jgi:hypothetical protein
MGTYRDIVSPLISQERAIGDSGDEPTSWFSHAYKYPVAVVGDLGQTVVNSAISAYNFVAPAAIEADHVDRYAFMSNDIAEYTAQHKSAVEFGSFMAGAIIPGLGISKAMSLARTGSSAWGYAYRGVGLSSFNKKIEAATGLAKTAAINGGRHTTEYQTAMRSARAWTYGEALTENALFEASTVALLSEHTYFEDGWSPTLGLGGIALGTGITGWLKWAKVGGEITKVAQQGQRLQDMASAEAVKGQLFKSASPFLASEYGWGTVLEAEKGNLADYVGGNEYLRNSVVLAGMEPQADTVLKVYGQRADTMLADLTRATEDRARGVLEKMSTPELAKMAQPSEQGRKAWELEFAPAPLGQTVPQIAEPDKARMSWHYIMGQKGQATGVEQLTHKLESAPLEASRAPFKQVGHGRVEFQPTEQFWNLLSHGTEDRVSRVIDPLTGTGVVTKPDRFNEIDRIAKYWMNPKTGVHNFDLSAVKGQEDALHYLAYQINRKMPGNAGQVHVNFGGAGNRLDYVYHAAIGKVNEAFTKDLATKYNTTEEASAALPGFFSEYQVLSRWEGQTVAQGSIEAHLTKRIGHKVQGNKAKLGIQTERMQIASSSAAKKPTYGREWKPIELASVRGPVLAASEELDGQFVRAYFAFEPLKGKLKPSASSNLAVSLDTNYIASNDVARLQAAWQHGAIVSGYGDQASLYKGLQYAKVENLRQMVDTFPQLSPMELSVRLNLPTDTVALLRQGLEAEGPLAPASLLIQRYVRKTDPEQWMVYKGAKDYEAALAEPSVSVLGRAGHQLPAHEIAAKLDQQGMERMAADIIDQATILRTQDPANQYMRDLHENLVRSSTMQGVRNNLAELAADAGAGSVLTSADFALRRFGVLSAHLTGAGSQLQEYTNNAITRFSAHVGPAARAVADDKVSATQFEYVKNQLAGLDSNAFDRSAGLVFTQDNKILLRNEVRDKVGVVTQQAEFLQYPQGGDIQVSQSVRTFMERTETAAKELWAMRETIAQIKGRALTSDRRNLWLPAPSLDHSMQAFIWNKAEMKVQRIIGRDMESFTAEVAAFRQANSAALASGDLTLHMRNDAELGAWLRIRNLAELEGVTTALPTMRRSGIAQTKVRGTPQAVNETIKDFEAQYNSLGRQYLRTANEDIFTKLDLIEAQHTTARKAGPSGSKLLSMQEKVSPATQAKAALLNLSQLGSNKALAAADDVFSYAVDKAAQGLQRGYQSYQKFAARGDYSPAAFQHMQDELQRAGVPVPWQDAIQFAASRSPELGEQAKSLVAQSNSIVATLALRLFDFSHPIVTTLTAPLVMTAEGVGQNGMSHLGAMKLVYETGRDWIRQAVNAQAAPEAAAVLAEGARLGHTALRVSEATRVLSSGFGSVSKWQEIEASKAFEWLCKASDTSEHATREAAYLMGYKLAKQTSPNADEAFLHSHAALFTNRAMGNYAARQRSVFFQGASGQAIGLFQTFMWTMGQNLFRYAENKQMNAIAGMLGGYTGLFGLNSLPAYATVDQAIGQWSKSPDDQDITSTIYQAFGDKAGGHSRSAAEYMLYGLPSTLLQTAFYTRGELQPRLPTNAGGLPVPPAIAMAGNALDTVTGIAQKTASLWASNAQVGQGGVGSKFKDVATATAEGVATQFIWRPAARLTELAIGHSLDAKGQTIASGEDVRGPWPAFARILSARPLEEQVIRNQNFRHRLYDTADSRKNKQLISTLRTQVRSGQQAGISGTMGRYLQAGGTPAGWRRALNEVSITESAPGASALLDEVSKQPGIAAIMEGYAF